MTNSERQIPNGKFRTTNSKRRIPNDEFQTTNSERQIPNDKFRTTNSEPFVIIELRSYVLIVQSLMKVESIGAFVIMHWLDVVVPRYQIVLVA